MMAVEGDEAAEINLQEAIAIAGTIANLKNRGCIDKYVQIV